MLDVLVVAISMLGVMCASMIGCYLWGRRWSMSVFFALVLLLCAAWAGCWVDERMRRK